MPHKVNPIWFETSEGNLKVANGLLRLLASEPQMSRLQRDLSDSTLKRNYGVALAHTLIAIENTLEGLNRISPDVQKISAELEAHPEVIGEAIQTILRRAKLEQPYEKLKEFLRGRKVSLAQIHTFIESLDVSRDVRRKLLAIAPKTYTGLAVRLTEMGIRRCEHILTELGLGD
jgi:adenylosuccinate lyase